MEIELAVITAVIKTGFGAIFSHGERVGRGGQIPLCPLLYTPQQSDTTPTNDAQNADSLYENRAASHPAENSTPIHQKHSPDTSPVDFTALLRHHYGTEFAGLATQWPTMPDHIRAAILALAGTVKP